MFIIYSLIWMACDRVFLEPVFKLFSHLGWFKNQNIRAGMSEVTIATALGITAGATVGPFLGIALSTNPWSWVATAALIFSSFIVSSAVGLS